MMGYIKGGRPCPGTENLVTATTEHDQQPAETTIGRLLQARAADMPDAVFAIFPEGEMRFGEIDRKARAVAKGLIALGVQPGCTSPP